MKICLNVMKRYEDPERGALNWRNRTILNSDSKKTIKFINIRHCEQSVACLAGRQAIRKSRDCFVVPPRNDDSNLVFLQALNRELS